MGNLVFTQGLPIFDAIYDAFFHPTFPTSNGLYTTFPTLKIVVNFRQATTYCGRFPQKSVPSNSGIRTIDKEKPRKTEVFRGKENFLALGELRCATGGLQTVLREFLSCFPLILRAFPAFCLSVIRCADHKKRPFFIQQ